MRVRESIRIDGSPDVVGDLTGVVELELAARHDEWTREIDSEVSRLVSSNVSSDVGRRRSIAFPHSHPATPDVVGDLTGVVELELAARHGEWTRGIDSEVSRLVSSNVSSDVG